MKDRLRLDDELLGGISLDFENSVVVLAHFSYMVAVNFKINKWQTEVK